MWSFSFFYVERNVFELFYLCSLQPSIFNITKTFFMLFKAYLKRKKNNILRILHMFSLRFNNIFKMFKRKHFRATFYLHFIIVKIYSFLDHDKTSSTNVYTMFSDLKRFHFMLRGTFSICFITICYCHLYLT